MKNKLLYILAWIPPLILKFVLAVLGLFLIPIFLKLNVNMKKLPIWGNREEGPPEWFLIDHSVYRWYAIRNPVNNTRYWFSDEGPFKTEGWQRESMEAHDLIANNVKEASRWCYRGWFAGYRKVWLTTYKKDKLLIMKSILKRKKVYLLAGTYYGEFWIGWKVGSHVPGLGFTLQWRRNREIGT